MKPSLPSITLLRSQMLYLEGDFAAKLGVTTAIIYRWEASLGVLNFRANAKKQLTRLFTQK